jgi:predicted ATPase
MSPIGSGSRSNLVTTARSSQRVASLAWQVAEKTEGNPLFAEEIVSFLSEREPTSPLLWQCAYQIR